MRSHVTRRPGPVARHLRDALLVLALVVAPLGLRPDAAHAANVGFVTTAGGQFVLNGAPFRFVGTNAYFMLDAVNYGSTAHTTQMLTLATDLGFTVLRTWAFMDGTGAEGGLQTAPGVYNETAARQLDWVLYMADQAGVRLILTLVNHWGTYGGMPQYVRWCAPGASVDAFYTHSACRQIYRNWVTYLVTRVNTYTGRAYRDDPTIFAWELANEPNSSDPTGETVRAWVAEMAGHIKSLDRNHMVGTGEEGFDTTTQGYQPLAAYNNQRWLFDGGKGVSFTRNTAEANIDFGSIHLYPEFWNFPASVGNTWIADHVRIARSLGKPLVIGEFGYNGPTGNPLAVFQSWLQTFEAEQGGGALVWQLICPACVNHGGFHTVYPPTTAVSSLFQSAAALANGAAAQSFTVGGTAATPNPAATGQAVSVQTSVTAAAAASNVAVALQVRDAAGATVGERVFAGQSFGAGQTLPYGFSWAGTPTAGTYGVAVAVRDAGGAVLASANPAATFTVLAPATTPSFTVGSSSATPDPVAPGQAVTVATRVTAGAASTGAVVDISVWNAAGARVAQQAYQAQSFAAGQTRAYSWSWTTPAALPAGTYRVSVGVFDSTWTTAHVWVASATAFAVQTPPPPATLTFTVGPTSLSANPATRGRTVTIQTRVIASAPAAGIIVDMNVYAASGSRVAQRAFTGQTFTAGGPRDYSWSWRVPANLPRGTYTVQIGVFDASWTRLYTWQNPAATFEVR